jgi:glycosyltransferase involved in cell wall biosynthesis
MLVSKSEIPTIQDSIPELAPARILEIELGEPLAALSAVDERNGKRYQRALCLVRLHTIPLGVVELQFTESQIAPSVYAQQVWNGLSAAINEHLQADALPAVSGLDAAGIPCPGGPRCMEERAQFFASAPFVSVIVPTHNRPETLDGCVRSLAQLHYPSYEVIVVDNAPRSSATADLVREISAEYPCVRYLLEDRPGVSWARNSGMMAARGEILAFTDDDVVVDRYWLIELVRGFTRANNVACVTGYNLPLELETPAQFWYEEYGGAYWFQKQQGTRWGFKREIYDNREHRASMSLYPYRAGMFGCGASMAFTATFLRGIHGFDPALGGNGPARCAQDIAVFFQVIMRGYTLVYEPASLVYHLHRSTFSALRKQIYNYGVGLTAYLTRNVLERPLLLFDMLGKAVYAGVAFLRGRRQPKHVHSPHYPSELSKLKLKGMLYGPLAYLQSRRVARRVRRQFASRESSL